MVKRLEEGVDARVLRWFGHMERMDGKRLAKRVWKTKVSGRRPRREAGTGKKRHECGGSESACNGPAL